jgi:hypothetical protein
MTRTARALLWIAIASIVVLLARAVAYALHPSVTARLLEHEAGGPALPTLVLTSLALGAALAIAICWLAALGVRERALLERRVLEEPVPPLAAGRTIALAVALSIATSLVGGLLEAYLHWRAGLGWHGLRCMFGPVHRDLIPIETAFSLVAVALFAAGEHVVGWMRRTCARLRALPPQHPLRARSFPAPALDVPPARRHFTLAAPRGPPAFS